MQEVFNNQKQLASRVCKESAAAMPQRVAAV